MANFWDFLDGVADNATSIYTAKTQAEQAAKTQVDQASAKPVATAQVAVSGSGSTWLYIGIGAAVLIGAVLLLRR